MSLFTSEFLYLRIPNSEISRLEKLLLLLTEIMISFTANLLSSHQKEVNSLKLAHQSEVGVLQERLSLYEDELLKRHGNLIENQGS
jgi:hypothetical protein